MRRLALFLMSTVAISPMIAFAQDADNSTTIETDDPTVLDRIIISGEKLDRDYLDTPTSVGVVTDEDIEVYEVQDVVDSFNRLANVRMLDSSGGDDLFSIRGLNGDGAAEVSNIVPLISTIIDGAVQNNEGSRRGFRSTWDLEQIEVLRGPQSSLYGRAALAGALVLESKDPTFFWEGAIEGEIGNFDKEGGAFVLSGPILEDQLAFRVSGESQKSTNNITYTDPANSFFGEDEYENYRVKLLWEPAEIDGLSALYTFNRAIDATGSDIVSGPDFHARVFSGNSFTSEFREIEVDNHIANVSFDFSDKYTVRSITSFIDTDLDISSLPGSAPSYQRQDNRVGDDFTQEFRLEIAEDEAPLSGIIGGFYGDFNQDTATSIQADSGLAGGGPPSGFIVPLQVGTITSEIETTAIYADLRYRLSEQWSLIGGLRYQEDEVRSTSNINSIFGPTASDVSADFDVWLPKYGIIYELGDMQTISFTGSRGYRSGFTTVENGVQNTIDPEFVWSHEIAYRYVSEDQNTSFGINVFHNDFQDQQVSTLVAGSGFLTETTNAGSSRSYGAEIEGRHDFENGLEIFGSLGLLETEFVDFNVAACAITCNGNEFPEAPNVTLAFGGKYSFDNGVYISADSSYTGSYYTGSDINNVNEIDGFFVANAAIGFETENLKASAYVKNLFDEEYETSITPGMTPAATTATIGDGRTYGVTLRAKF